MDEPSLAFHYPELVETEGTKVRDDRHSELADAFLAQCENKMMAIN